MKLRYNYAKCVEMTPRHMTLQFPDGTKQTESIPKWMHLVDKGTLHIINITYSEDDDSPSMDVDCSYIQEYEKLGCETSVKSDKAYTKGSIIGVIEDEYDDKLYDTLVVTDRNNKVGIVRNLKARQIMFIGDMPLQTKSNATFECDTCIVDNKCVMSNILPIENNMFKHKRVNIIAEHYIIKHEFIDLYTIREVNHIFKMIYGLDQAVANKVRKNHYIVIEIDFTKSGLSKRAIEEEVDYVVASNDLEASFLPYSMEIYNTFRNYAFVFSMYKSLGFKSGILKEKLEELENMLETDQSEVEFKYISKYNAIKRQAHSIAV